MSADVDRKTQVLHLLSQHQIPYQIFDHPPLFTCEDAQRLAPTMPGFGSKNLFLTDKSGAFYLLMIPEHKRVDLKALAINLQCSKLSFGSEEALFRILSSTPGAVTILSLMFAQPGAIYTIVDQEIWDAPEVQCHPMDNSSTCVLSHQALEDFLKASGHKIAVLQLPRRD